MTERKAWTREEDQLMIQIIDQRDPHLSPKRVGWNNIAEHISKLVCKNIRTGKQCRQRWFNHLRPDIVKEHSWSLEQQHVLFQRHDEIGNHWAKISKYLLGRSENSIKNYFYCCLRKALRKVNIFLQYNKRGYRYKYIKPYTDVTITKFMAVLQKKASKRIHIFSEQAFILAKQIKNLLIDIQVYRKQEPKQEHSEHFELIIEKIQNFNRICKRKKMKSKDSNKTLRIKSQIKKQQIEDNRQQDAEQQEEWDSGQDDSFQESMLKLEQPEDENQNANQQNSNNEKQQSLQKIIQKPSIKQEKIGLSQFSYKNAYNDSSNFNNSVLQENSTVKMSLETGRSFDFSKTKIQSNFKPFIPMVPIIQSTFYHGSGFMPRVYSSPFMFYSSIQKEFQELNLQANSIADLQISSPQIPVPNQSKTTNIIKPKIE